MTELKPARRRSTDTDLHAVQVAFDVEAVVLEAVRRAAFESNLSNSDQIRSLLGLAVSGCPKRPRLTVTLAPEDYEALATRYELSAEDHLAIKERVTQELTDFARQREGA